MGLAPLTLFTVTPLIVRNQRILTAWDARHRAAQPLRSPKTRPAAQTLTALAAYRHNSAPNRSHPIHTARPASASLGVPRTFRTADPRGFSAEGTGSIAREI